MRSTPKYYILLLLVLRSTPEYSGVLQITSTPEYSGVLRSTPSTPIEYSKNIPEYFEKYSTLLQFFSKYSTLLHTPLAEFRSTLLYFSVAGVVFCLPL